MLTKGSLKARAFKRVMGLLELDGGQTLQAVATMLGVDYNTVATWRGKYQEQGLACLQEAPRSGRPLAGTVDRVFRPSIGEPRSSE